MLLELPAFSQVPGPDCVVQAPRPQLGPVVGDVDTAGPVRVALELPGVTGVHARQSHMTTSKSCSGFFSGRGERMMCVQRRQRR